MIKQLVILMLLPLLVLAACTPNVPPGSKGVVFAQSGVEREQASSISDEDLQALSAAKAAFAFNFYKQIKDKPGNLVFSPLSLSLALSMTMAGAQGTTLSEMQQALAVEGLGDAVHPGMNALLQALAESEAQEERKAEGDPFQLNIANSTWGQAGFEINPAFLDLLAQHYGAGVYQVDFAQDSELARQAINDWVSEETAGKIPELIGEGVLNPLTRLVLANAIYFNGSWYYPFYEEATEKADFTLLDGTLTSVEMMQLGAEQLAYAQTENYQLLRLPYLSQDFGMLLIVPDEGAFGEVEAGLDAQRFLDSQAEMQSRPVFLKMPKFDFESATDASEPLKQMGMPTAFDPVMADFSAITGKPDLYITDVLHKATVSVNEKGTEAAAATAVIMAIKSAPPQEPINLVIDRPFLFAIQHLPSNTILFMGRVQQP